MAQQIVPPFNKKEVQSICQEGLDNGEIKIATGTKLYRHTFSKIQTSPFTRSAMVVNTKKQAYQGASYQGVLQSIAVVDMENPISITGNYMYIGLNYDTDNNCYKPTTTINLSNEPIVDTVEEL